MCQMCDDGEKASAGQEMTAPAAEPAKMPEKPSIPTLYGTQQFPMIHAHQYTLLSKTYDALRTFCQQQAATIEQLRGEVERKKEYEECLQYIVKRGYLGASFIAGNCLRRLLWKEPTK